MVNKLSSMISLYGEWMRPSKQASAHYGRVSQQSVNDVQYTAPAVDLQNRELLVA